jgi:O-antigen ligase
MESLHDFLTVVSMILFVVISITSVSSKCDYWVKMIALYLYFGFTACLIIPFGIISQNPIKSK